MAFYKKRIVRPDTADDIAWRAKDSAARALAREEVKARFPVITPENFAEAADFQERRIRELRGDVSY